MSPSRTPPAILSPAPRPSAVPWRDPAKDSTSGSSLRPLSPLSPPAARCLGRRRRGSGTRFPSGPPAAAPPHSACLSLTPSIPAFTPHRPHLSDQQTSNAPVSPYPRPRLSRLSARGSPPRHRVLALRSSSPAAASSFASCWVQPLSHFPVSPPPLSASGCEK